MAKAANAASSKPKKPKTTKSAKPSTKKPAKTKPNVSSEVSAVVDAVIKAVEGRTSTAFNGRGEPCEPLHEHCVAKKTENGTYFIKFDGGDIFEPSSGMKLRHCKFREVSEQVYQLYIEFLKTKNVSYLRKANHHITSSPIKIHRGVVMS